MTLSGLKIFTAGDLRAQLEHSKILAPEIGAIPNLYERGESSFELLVRSIVYRQLKGVALTPKAITTLAYWLVCVLESLR